VTLAAAVAVVVEHEETVDITMIHIVETRIVATHALAHVLLLGGMTIGRGMTKGIGMMIGNGTKGDVARLGIAGGMMTGGITGESVSCSMVLSLLIIV